MQVARAIILTLLLAATSHAADVTVSLPLEGYYRPGQLMPVRLVSANAAGAQVELHAAGAIPTRLYSPTASLNAVAPWLVYSDQISNARIITAGVETPLSLDLKPLSPDQRLVGVASAQMPDDAWLQNRFPGKEVIPIRLSTADLTAGPIAAWGVLDALVIDASTLPVAPAQQNVSPVDTWEDRVHKWLAEGIKVIVRGDAPYRYSTVIHWTELDDSPGDWMVAVDIAGPQSYFDGDAYMPVAGWKPGRSREFRAQLMLRAALFAILVLIAALWRPRTAHWSALAIALCFAPAVAFWETRQPTLESRSGAVLAVQWTGGVQSDVWTYTSALAPRSLTSYHPVFASPRHAQQLEVVLFCRAEPEAYVSFEYEAGPGDLIATLQRRLVPHEHLPTRPDDSIFTRFAASEYESAEWTLSGVAVTVPLELNMAETDWDVVVLEEKAPQPTTR